MIPCFNQAHFLGEAIESVLARRHPGVEVTVVDDGSADNSYEVAGRYPGVRRLRQPHRGVAAARNRGLAESTGDLVVFLDADDRLLPRRSRWGCRGCWHGRRSPSSPAASRDIGGDGGVTREGGQPLVTQDHFLHLLEGCYIWSGSSIVYRREAIEAVGGFDERLGAGDDYDLYLRLAHGYPIYCHGRVVTEYRRHGTNTTRDPGIVLASQLRVLEAQRPTPAGPARGGCPPAWHPQYPREAGTGTGRPRWPAAWRNRHWLLARQAMRTLVRAYPLGLLRLALGAPREEAVGSDPRERGPVG